MKTIRENKVQEVLDYVKKFQFKEGRSPSFRQIAKAVGFSSISTAQKYVKVLKERNLIKQNSVGRIITPANLSTGKTIIAPKVGEVACGSPILAVQNIEKTFSLPTSIFGSEPVMVLDACGDSMIGAGIYHGDLIIARISNTAENGDIVVARIDDSATVKRYFKEKDYYRLHPENPKYNDIIVNEVDIQGVVKQVIHYV